MLKVYGTPLCKDCLAMKIIFTQKNIEFEYFNITANTGNLKEFLHFRDTLDLFAEKRAAGALGIPFFTCGDKMSFDINEAFAWINAEPISEIELARITAECEALLK